MIFQHFGLICGLWVGLGGFLFGKFRSKELVAQGSITVQESKSLLLGWLLSILIPSLLFWLLALSIDGPQTPDFVSWPNPQKSMALVLLLGCWGLLLYWVFALEGSSKLAKLFMLTGNFPQSWLQPAFIKGLVVLTVAAGVASILSQGI